MNDRPEEAMATDTDGAVADPVSSQQLQDKRDDDADPVEVVTGSEDPIAEHTVNTNTNTDNVMNDTDGDIDNDGIDDNGGGGGDDDDDSMHKDADEEQPEAITKSHVETTTGENDCNNNIINISSNNNNINNNIINNNSSSIIENENTQATDTNNNTTSNNETNTAVEGERSSFEAPEYLSSSMCSICIDDFEDGEKIVMLPRCQHLFHRECIRPWLMERQGCCPLCKTPVLVPPEGDDGENGGEGATASTPSTPDDTP